MSIAAYFIVVGPDDKELLPIDEDSNGNAFMPGPLSPQTPFTTYVTDRYPTQDRPKDPLPEGIQLFCLPRGAQLSLSAKRPSLHTFVQTNEVGEHLLGCCLTFYEPATAAQRASLAALFAAQTVVIPEHIYVPRCLCLVSRHCFPSAFKKVLCGLYYQHTLTSSVPLERYICNFIDDVPHPLEVRLDISFYMNDQPITFKCPSPEEPPVWSGMPLFPLLECLPPAVVLELFALVLCERQIVFISQQCSLLTACAQGMASLIFPLSWPHALIPVLPRQLVGVLEAPHPFICGVPTAYLHESPVQEESVKVFLDEARLDLGSEGPALALPETLRKRLMQHLRTHAPIFDKRSAAWKTQRLPLFDDAFCSLTDHSSRQIAVPVRTGTRRPPSGKLVIASHGSVTLCHERKVRAGFLNFFVGLLHNYRQYLIHGTALVPDPPVKFRFKDFTKSHPLEWRPLLTALLQTQAFSQFLDERVLTGLRDADVIFFDDAIDARAGRSGPKTAPSSPTAPVLKSMPPEGPERNISGTSRFYVPPSPDTTGLPFAGIESGAEASCTYSYARFPHLSVSLFTAPRALMASSPMHPQSHVTDVSARLKRTSAYIGPAFPSELACVYSCYLVATSLVVSSADKVHKNRRLGHTTNRVIADYAPIPQQPERLTDDAPGAEFCAVQTPVAATTQAQFSLAGEEAQAIALLLTEEPRDERSELAALELVEMEESYISEHDTNPGNARTEFSTSDVEALECAHLDAPNEDFYTVSPKSKPIHNFNDDCTPTSPPSMILVPKIPTSLSSSEALVASIFSSVAEQDGRDERDRADLTAYWCDRDKAVAAAARLGLRVALETLNCLLRQGELPDDVAFRCLMDACGVCGDTAGAVDLLALLQEEDVLLDKGLLRSAARAAGAEAATLNLASQKVPINTAPALPEPVLNPVEVWTTQDWRSIQRRRGAGAVSCLFSRRSRSYAVLPVIDTAVGATGKLLVPRIPAPTMLTLANPSSGSPGRSILTAEAGAGGLSPVKRNGAASAKLSRQMAISEALLESIFPGLHIDLCHVLGTQCPGAPRTACPSQRPLSSAEIARGWAPGDSNGYATTCVHCGTVFVPRFAVTCALPGFIGSDGPGTPLWCELLSPWTLRKELLKVVLEGGVAALASSEFRDATHSERAVLFWNALVAFRSRGLPFSFLLNTDMSISFPPKQ